MNKIIIITLALLLIFSGNLFAVAPNDPGRDCESKTGQFIDFNGDGQVTCEDWDQMPPFDKELQARWNIETMCEECTPEKVRDEIKRWDMECE